VLLETATFLGPALVLENNGPGLRVSIDGDVATPRLALSSGYQPQPGDMVLVIGRDDDSYVIGVLHGTGPTVMSVPGPLMFRAAGTVDIVSGREIRVHAPRVRVQATTLELLAQSLVERVGRASRWVRESLHLRAGRVRTRVEEDYDIAARRIVGRAEKDVRLDGEQINLG
jgi:hypothetical protein